MATAALLAPPRHHAHRWVRRSGVAPV